MCGIFFSLSRHGYIDPGPDTERLLINRGPDSTGKHQAIIPQASADDQQSASQLYATYLSTVLALRGPVIVSQPLRDICSGSVLCWNGEAWKIGKTILEGNDSQEILNSLLEACALRSDGSRSSSKDRVIDFLSTLRGPFAFVFYDAANQYLYYGRDCLGRRSLLRKNSGDDELILSSVCDNATGENWEEVEADGIYVVDLKPESTQPTLYTLHVPHNRKDEQWTHGLFLVGKYLCSRVFTDYATSASLSP